MTRRTDPNPVFRLCSCLFFAAQVCLGNPLQQTLGRSEVRIVTAPFSLAQKGLTVQEIFLVERLGQLEYERVRGTRPAAPGEYFWGTERFWIYRRGFIDRGRWREARLLDVRFADKSQRIMAVFDERGVLVGGRHAVLEPKVLAETLRPGRAARVLVEIDDLPERVWRAVLASEDGRFFSHGGVDSRSVARAVLANAKKGGVAQGGSTITQQLIKIRDLTPKRTFGRKLSEAVRALALEMEVDKRDILESYLNSVYFGHVKGIELYGIGAAAKAFFSKDARDLSLGEAALLAGVIQSPNRLSPVRNPSRALQRRRYVLGRLLELEWAGKDQVEALTGSERLGLNVTYPKPMTSASLLSAIARDAGRIVAERLRQGRGFVIETHLDAWLQEVAENAMRKAAKRGSIQGAFVAGDVRLGRIVAHVGSVAVDNRDELDRVRRARRQPGSTVKPLVVLEAIEDCGSEKPLTLATMVADRPITLELPSGPWTPKNSDRQSRGIVSVRQVLKESLNQPTVRLARYCGFGKVAQRFLELGLVGPKAEEPAFVLGALEASPLEVLQVYSRFAASKRLKAARNLVARVLAPDGDVLFDTSNSRGGLGHVPSPGIRFLMRDALADAASSAGIELLGVWGKTGTSSGGRDAWFAGGAGDWVAVVWMGHDEGQRGGLSGRRNAAPVFQEWMKSAAPLAQKYSREDEERARARLVRKRIDGATGLVLRQDRPGSRWEWFRKGTVPSKRRWWKPGITAPVIE